ncbi:transcription initiation factor IID subunit-like protein [Leptotrombidium deliense]|uniref:Transcription initiation factor TFIID subunit 13 n=1 Tax=Leptotrombidium deliense TaxID=299467 RepID=A0A443RZH1_9ACAR|nr:transcription initiation factor IID subunit-like protein [Leptotrombidium deliense]
MAANDDFDEEIEQDNEPGTSVDQFTGDKRKRLFSKELRCMMYGFGDDENPYTESVDLLEDMVIQYIIETTYKAMEVGRQGRVQVEDVMYLMRKDGKKYARVKDLLLMNEELKKARKAFDEVKYAAL